MSVGVIVKKEPTKAELIEWLASAPGFLEGFGTWEDEPLVLEDYQIAHLNDTARFRFRNKARQTGFSFVMALEAVYRAQVYNRNRSTIFVSYKDDEAKEKVRYAKMFYEELPPRWKRKRIVDNVTSLEFVSSNGKYHTRIMSHPQREPRGPGGGVDVVLDEFGHYVWQDKIYTASVPIITRNHGTLTVNSTPSGKGNKFHEIGCNLKKYPYYSRMWIYWWDSQILCKDVPRARREAPYMSTFQRVVEFGTQNLLELFSSMDIETFQQEFECSFLDETLAFFPYSLIYANVPELNGKPSVQMAETFQQLADMVDEGIIKGELYAGYDVGRKKNTSELYVHEVLGDSRYTRLIKSYDQVKFREQEAELDELMNLMERRGLVRLGIDQNGIGMNLAENLADKYPYRVEPVELTNASKARMAVNVRIGLERKNHHIPADRELINHIHSIKRLVTSHNNVRYDTEKNEEHHADKFWAMAIAEDVIGQDWTKDQGIRAEERNIDEMAGTVRSEDVELHQDEDYQQLLGKWEDDDEEEEGEDYGDY